MKRIDFRLEDDWYELAQIVAKEMQTSIHQVAAVSLIQNIRMMAMADSDLAKKLLETMKRQRQRNATQAVSYFELSNEQQNRIAHDRRPNIDKWWAKRNHDDTEWMITNTFKGELLDEDSKLYQEGWLPISEETTE